MIKNNKNIENLPCKCRSSVVNFVSQWNSNENFLGALLVGSYATGLNNNQSDLDILIILNDKVKYWKRGNIRTEKFLIEYGIYPTNYLKYLEKKDEIEGKRLRTRMLATGKIIFDDFGIIKKLQKEARKSLIFKLPKTNRIETELRKYTLWDQLDNLIYLDSIKSPGFLYTYYVGIQNTIQYYSDSLGVEIPRPNNIFLFLNSEEFCDKYYLKKFPDKYFKKLFIQALKNPNIIKFQTLTEYTQKQFGGFSIDNWELSGKTKQATQKK